MEETGVSPADCSLLKFGMRFASVQSHAGDLAQRGVGPPYHADEDSTSLSS